MYQRSWVVHLLGSDYLPENLAHEHFLGSIGLFLALHGADTGTNRHLSISFALRCAARLQAPSHLRIAHFSHGLHRPLELSQHFLRHPKHHHRGQYKPREREEDRWTEMGREDTGQGRRDRREP